MTQKTISDLQARGIKFKDWMLSHKVFLVIGLFVFILLVIGVQKACDNRAEQIEDERIKAYELQLAENLKVFQSYIEMANRDHETTTKILDTMSEMTVNINNLKENDKKISARVEEISRTEYAAARNQKNNQAAIRSGKAPTNPNAKPIQKRETDALKADAELYPDN